MVVRNGKIILEYPYEERTSDESSSFSVGKALKDAIEKHNQSLEEDQGNFRLEFGGMSVMKMSRRVMATVGRKLGAQKASKRHMGRRSFQEIRKLEPSLDALFDKVIREVNEDHDLLSYTDGNWGAYKAIMQKLRNLKGHETASKKEGKEKNGLKGVKDGRSQEFSKGGSSLAGTSKNSGGQTERRDKKSKSERKHQKKRDKKRGKNRTGDTKQMSVKEKRLTLKDSSEEEDETHYERKLNKKEKKFVKQKKVKPCGKATEDSVKSQEDSAEGDGIRQSPRLAKRKERESQGSGRASKRMMREVNASEVSGKSRKGDTQIRPVTEDRLTVQDSGEEEDEIHSESKLRKKKKVGKHKKATPKGKMTEDSVTSREDSGEEDGIRQSPRLAKRKERESQGSERASKRKKQDVHDSQDRDQIDSDEDKCGARGCKMPGKPAHVCENCGVLVHNLCCERVLGDDYEEGLFVCSKRCLKSK